MNHPFSRAAERKTNRTIRPAAAPRTNTGQLLAGENVEDFLQLTASLVDHYHPASAHEYSLIEDLACERWLLLRRLRAHNAIEAELFTRQPDPSQWSEIDFKRLAQADRYRLQAERIVHRALKRVNEFRQEHLTNYRWEATYDMAVRQLEFEKKKHERETSGRAGKMEIAA